jgi:CRISPR-associated protein Csb2
MFAFAVHYLSGRSYAADYRDRERPEWPPHPARFFSAMVSALYESGLGQEARAALLWLETLGAPLINVDEAWERGNVITYVPTNEEPHDSVPSLRNLKKQGRSFPSVTLKTPLAYFIWAFSQESECEAFARHEAALRDIASRVTYLGSSASLVSVSLTTSPPEATLVPDKAGDLALRVVSAGRLEELELAYRLGQRPPLGNFRLYRRNTPPPLEEAEAESLYKDFLAFRLGGSLPIKAAAMLCKAVRDEVARLAGDRGDTLVLGRGHHPHCAFVALPDVGFEYSDGHLLGFAVLVPKAFEGEDRRAVFLALARLEKQLEEQKVLRIGDAGEFTVEPVGEDASAARGLREATWCRPSRVWESVTPVLFDRYPKAEKVSLSAGDIIAGSCTLVGLPVPEVVSVGKFSSFTGVPPADPKFFPLKDAQAGRYAAHVTVEFKEEVKGPVVLGAGRHYGLGLMRPIRAEAGVEDLPSE